MCDHCDRVEQIRRWFKVVGLLVCAAVIAWVHFQ